MDSYGNQDIKHYYRKAPEVETSNENIEQARIDYIKAKLSGLAPENYIAQKYDHVDLTFLEMAYTIGFKHLSATGSRKVDDPNAAIHAAVTQSDILGNTLATAMRDEIIRQSVTIDSILPMLSIQRMADFKPGQFLDFSTDKELTELNENEEIPVTFINAADVEQAALAEHGRRLALTMKALTDPAIFSYLASAARDFADAYVRKATTDTANVLIANANMADGLPLFHEDRGNDVAVSHGGGSQGIFFNAVSALMNQPTKNGTPAMNKAATVFCRAQYEAQMRGYLTDAKMHDEIKIIVAPDSMLDSSWYFMAASNASPTLALLTPESGQPISTSLLRPKNSFRGLMIGQYADFKVAAISPIGIIRVQE